MEAINIQEIMNSVKMSPEDLLVSKLEQYIAEFKSTLRTPQMRDELKELESKRDYYHDAMKGIITIDQLDPNDINIIPAEDRDFFRRIKFIADLNKVSPENGEVKIEKNQRKIISSIYHELSVSLLNRINYLKREIQSSHDDITYGTIEIYEKIIKKIKSGLALERDDYDNIRTMLEDEETISINDNELFVLYTFLGRYILSEHNLVNVDSIPDDDEIIDTVEENVHLLDEQVLIDIFAKYGYDYNILSPEKKKLLKEYGKVDKINNIFEVFAKYRVDNDYLDNLALILVYSSPDIVTSIFDNIDKDKTKDVSAEQLFGNYMSTPNLFISGKKVCVDNSGSSEINFDGEKGLYNKYQANRLFFISKGFNITRALNKCISIFGTKNQTLVDTYAKYISYDIPKETIEEKLSCLSVKDVYEMMDLLIEQRIEDYLKNHISRSVQISRKYVRRMVLAKMLGYPYINENGTLPGYITNLQDSELLRAARISSADLEKGIAERIEETEYFDTDSLKEEKEIYDGQVANVIYIRDRKLEENKYINYLDNNFLDSTLPNVYNIQGVLISRRKVLRVYGELVKKHDWNNNKNLLMYAITYKSVLTRTQLAEIEKTVDYILEQTRELK